MVNEGKVHLFSLVLGLVDFELGTTLGCSGDYLEVGGERLCGLLTGQTSEYVKILSHDVVFLQPLQLGFYVDI